MSLLAISGSSADGAPDTDVRFVFSAPMNPANASCSGGTALQYSEISISRGTVTNSSMYSHVHPKHVASRV